MKHKHHIIPKHIGGSDDPSNLILLTPQEHAEAHRILWEKHQRWQDYLAWQGLSQRLNKEQLSREASRLANKGKISPLKGKKLGARDEAVKRKISETMKRNGIQPSDEVRKIGLAAAHKAVRGRHVSSEERKAKSQALKLYNTNNPRPFRPRSEEAKLKTSISLSKPLYFQNKHYSSLKQCKEENNISRHKIVTDPSFRWSQE